MRTHCRSSSLRPRRYPDDGPCNEGRRGRVSGPPYGPDVIFGSNCECCRAQSATLQERATLQALRDRYDSLALRERQVMALVVRGLLNNSGRRSRSARSR